MSKGGLGGKSKSMVIVVEQLLSVFRGEGNDKWQHLARREPETPTGRAGSPGPASLNAPQPNLNRLSLAETPLPLASTSSTMRSILPASATVSSFAVCASRSSPGRSDRAGLGAGHDGDLVYVLVSGQQV